MEGNERTHDFNYICLVRIRHKGVLGFRIRPYFSKFLGPFSLTGMYWTRWYRDFPSLLAPWSWNGVNMSCCCVSYSTYLGFFGMPCIWTPFLCLRTHLHYMLVGGRNCLQINKFQCQIYWNGLQSGIRFCQLERPDSNFRLGASDTKRGPR